MRIGILGGGQLGRMLALAGLPLGLRFRVWDHAPDAPAGAVAELFTAEFEDLFARAGFLLGLDVATFEWENIPLDLLRLVAQSSRLAPGIDALEIKHDRCTEKQFFRKLGIETAPFAAADSPAELEIALEKVAPPVVLKTRRHGYDGKGQAVVHRRVEAARVWNELGGVPLIVEGRIAFDRELSLIGARNPAGQIAFYPLVENRHERGILVETIGPAPRLTPQLQSAAEQVMRAVMESLDYVGVLAIEFFECNGRLLTNEMAPRVHNSGHWSIEGAETSQFENHVRAVTGLPLGSTRPLPGTCLMLNLLGAPPPDLAPWLAVPGCHLHLYGKAPRPGRKVGHMTIRIPAGESLDALRARLAPLPGADALGLSPPAR